jgi:hypothetical protein
MQAGHPNYVLVLSIFITTLKAGYTVGESVDVVDFSDLAIYDTFNGSYLAAFNEEFIYSGKAVQ